MIKSTRKLLLLLAVTLISLSASTLRADSKLIIDSCWDRYYGLIYKGSDQGITVNLEFEVWRDGKQIGVFKIFGVEETSSKGVFKPIDGNDVLKEGDSLKGPGGTEWAPAPKQERKEEKSAKRSLKLSVDKSDEESKTDEAKKASDDKDKEFPRRINPKEDKIDSSADKKSDTSVKKEEKKEEKKEKKEEKKKAGDDKSKVITKPKEEKQSDKKQVVDKKEAKTAKQEKSGNKEKTRFGLKNSEKSKVQPAVASDDKAIAISKEEQDKSADKNTKKNEPEKLASAKSEEPAKEKPAEGKQKFGLNTGEGSTEPSTSVDENNAKTEPAQQETGGEKTKNKFGLISDLPEKKQSPSEASNINEEAKTTDKTEVVKEEKGESSGKFGLKTSKTTSNKGDNKEIAKTEPVKKDKEEKTAEKESPKGLPVKLTPEKEDNSNIAGSGRKKKTESKVEVAKVDNGGNNNSKNDKQAGKEKTEETTSEKKPAEGDSSKGLPIKLSPEKEDNSNLTSNKREKKTENKEAASGDKGKQEKIEKVIPWTAQKHIYAADNYFYDRDYNLALEHYSAALTLDPKNEKAKSGIVDCSKKLGVAIEPKDKPKETAENKQQTFKAENFGTADTSNMNKYDVADVENNYGVYLIQEKNYKEAIEWLNKAINDKPDEAIYYRNRAVAYFKAGDIVKAVYDAKAAFEKGDEKSKDLLLMLKKSLEENEKKQSDSNSGNKITDGK